MSDGWIVAVSVTGWLILSLIVGRVVATREYRQQRRKGQIHECARRVAEEDGFGAAVLWPLAVVLSPILGLFLVGGWLLSNGIDGEKRKIDERRERVAQLREDACEWDEKRRTGTDAEREMAAQLARMCREQADDLEGAV